MATGVPKKKAAKAVAKAEVSLVYPGKKSEKEILSLAPGNFNAIRKPSDNSSNILYFGENLSALSHMYYRESLAGKIKLIYIDPPFATQTVFHSRKLEHAYEDLFEVAQYIEFMRERILFLYKLLSDDGSIYVHIDAKMLFHVKIIMDEIFGVQQFRNCITRRKSNPKNYTSKQFGNISDYILFYSKGREYTWNRQFEPWTDERAREYRYVEPDTGRRFMKVPVHAPGIRNGETGRPWRGVLPPPGKHWQFPP
jgi:adenine-specific DNA-methyltransferase